ncbi:hypothetical protein LGT39_06705 [Demequina sp. TTPB684]|uniref:hypothetical protein n=1 Tax=unclassified Demequina TaxID=2620311 RepID=UPI001CF3B8F4|nr:MULTISPECIES: hypothetical protein [unclassified Demequina]MCB2412538.1 hypothetical protein [Demequina sp. TTPB684]UPU87340.1 hypothetical protein LGT36_008625 [Demequina sp. TMPB413]
MANDHSRAALPGPLDPSLSDNDLAQLARSEQATVRAAAAAHPNTPLTIILQLARDEAHVVRAGVARNPRPGIPEEVLRDLATDNAAEVVFALIANDSVPDSVIARVMRGKHKDAYGPAKARLSKSGTKTGILGGLAALRG